MGKKFLILMLLFFVNSLLAQESRNALDEADILFSDKPFTADKNESSKIEFVATDNIYARLILEKSIKETFDPNDEQEDNLEVLVNMIHLQRDAIRQYEYAKIKIPNSMLNKKVFDFEIFPSVNSVNTVYYTAGNTHAHLGSVIKNTFNSPYTDGNKAVFRVEIGNDKKFYGFFAVTVGKKDPQMLEERYLKILENMTDAKASTTELPKVFKMAAGKNIDPALSHKNLLSKISSPDFVVVKAKIAQGSKDYDIVKNSLGIPLYKITARPFWVVYKDNNRCYIRPFKFSRNYAGNGKYGELQIASIVTRDTKIPCEKVK